MNHTDWIFDFSLQAQVAAGKKRFNLDVCCRSKARRLAIIGPSGSGKSLTLQPGNTIRTTDPSLEGSKEKQSEQLQSPATLRIE